MGAELTAIVFSSNQIRAYEIEQEYLSAVQDPEPLSIRNEAKVFLGEENHKMQNCRKTKTTAIMEAKKYLQPHLLGVAIRTTLLHAVVKAESSGIENEQNELNYHQSGVGTYLVKIS